MTKKFTFKRSKGDSWHPDTIHIKYEKMVVGQIRDKKPYTIRLQIVKDSAHDDKNPNCTWMWVSLLFNKFETLDEAKEFLNNSRESIHETYTLHKMEGY
jgi:hypothetical protein